MYWWGGVSHNLQILSFRSAGLSREESAVGRWRGKADSSLRIRPDRNDKVVGSGDEPLRNSVTLREEETSAQRSFLAVEGALLPADVVGVRVLRLREFARAERTHCAQDDRDQKIRDGFWPSLLNCVGAKLLCVFGLVFAFGVSSCRVLDSALGFGFVHGAFGFFGALGADFGAFLALLFHHFFAA
jgi:hypothetical protein